jgi:hypothetical protein
MRKIYITVDGEVLIPSETMIGYAGEHKATTVEITLPQSWKKEGMTYYLAFNRSIDTPVGGVISDVLTPIDGVVSFALPQAVTVEGRLRMQLQARNEELVVLTAVCNLTIAHSILPAKKVDDAYSGLLDAIKVIEGPPGKPFTYEDFTEEQLAELKGEPFTYDDFTEEQLESLRGEPGKTPKNGVDYNTPEEQEEMVQKVLNSLPTWNGGIF